MSNLGEGWKESHDALDNSAEINSNRLRIDPLCEVCFNEPVTKRQLAPIDRLVGEKCFQYLIAMESGKHRQFSDTWSMPDKQKE